MPRAAILLLSCLAAISIVVVLVIRELAKKRDAVHEALVSLYISANGDQWKNIPVGIWKRFPGI